MASMQAAESSERRRLKVVGVSCKPGCNHCCHRHVEITVGEAAVIVSHLRSSGAWKDVKKAALTLADRSRTCTPEAWFKMRTRCPVLAEDGTCSAYQVRPSACSAHLVTSPPASCDPWAAEAPAFSPVDMKDVFMEAQVAIRESLPEAGIMLMTLPLPLALLVADRVAVRTDLTLEQAMEIISRET